MTLVVGIRCTDGVVIGTDSAMTFTSGQHATIAQPFLQKIEIIRDRIIVAGTGAIGLGQRVATVIGGLWDKRRFQGNSAVYVGRIMAEFTINDFVQTKVPPGNYGAFVAVPLGGRAELIEFALTDFQPEVKTKDNWYASMGSGQPVADPLLGFMRKTFWGNKPPSRQDGVFAVTMVLKLGCAMAPTGVAEPIQIATLSEEKEGKLSARRLTTEELLEHQGNVDDALSYFGQYQDVLHGTDKPAQELPKAPFMQSTPHTSTASPALRPA